MEKSPLLVIAGPTACGKTDVSISLAKRLNCEIISADSMQIYKYMDIGTAKATKEEMQGIRHYLIDELYPDEEYSVAAFQRRAKQYIQDIERSGKSPIITGGTGFYINALLFDNEFTHTQKDSFYRESLYKIASEKGNEYVHKMLAGIDSESAEAIHPNNVKRVVRALEFFEQTGQKISEHNKTEKKREIRYDAKMAILNIDRDNLYQRINDRVDKMIEKGLVFEVENLLKMGYSESLTSMQGLGYKEIARHIKGEITLNEAVETLKMGTRHFAKRQLTWFRRQMEGKWFNVHDYKNIDELANSIADHACAGN